MNFTTIRILLAAAILAVCIHPTTAHAADAPPVEMPDDFVQCDDNSDDVTEWCDDVTDDPTLPPTECKCPPGRPRLTSSLCCITVGTDPDSCLPCQYGCHKTDDGLTCNSKP